MAHRFVEGIIPVAILAVGLMLSACVPGKADVNYDPSVKSIPAGDAQSYRSIPAENGALACGVFDVNGHGGKEVRLEDYPDCRTAGLTIRCLDGEGHWQKGNISDLRVSGIVNKIEFISHQAGICGIFQRPRVPGMYIPKVSPLEGSKADRYLAISTANGQTPCGVFDVNGKNYKLVELDQYPLCQPDSGLKVMCLNNEDQWVADTVRGVWVNQKRVLEFISGQDGVCGIFKQP